MSSAIRFRIIFALLISTSCVAGAMGETALQAKVAGIAADAGGVVSVACLLPGTQLNCDLHPHNHSPMQSMFKFPLAVTVLHLVDSGRLLPEQRPGDSVDTTLDRTVRFLPEDRIPHSYSPLTDRYPGANVDISLRELIRLAAGESDNGATETLLRIIGGPRVVQDYVRSLGIEGFRLQDGEKGLHQDPAAQYRNWIEPAAAIELLQLLVENPPLSQDANAFLLKVLTDSRTTVHRLRAGLPAGTVLAHKSGTSGEHNGKAEATNDIGLISLPDGRLLAVAVFVTDATANEATRDNVIARIGRAAYDDGLRTPNEVTLIDKVTIDKVTVDKVTVPDIAPGFALPAMQRLSDKVYVVRLSPRLWVHSTIGTLADGSLYTANGVLLEDGDTSILFDVGWTPEEARILLDWAREVLKHPVSKAYVTHFHNDRLGGAAELERQHIPVFATNLTVELAKKTDQPVPDHVLELPAKPTTVAPDAVIFYPGPGHTQDNIVIDFPSEEILFGGCFVKADNATGIGNLADADVAAWPASLKRTRDAFPTTKGVIPGHGPIGANAIARTLELLK